MNLRLRLKLRLRLRLTIPPWPGMKLSKSLIPYLHQLKDKEKVVVISMMLTCDDSVVVGYDERRSRLCNEAINRKYDNYKTEI